MTEIANSFQRSGSEQIDHQHTDPAGGADRQLLAPPDKISAIPEGTIRMWKGGPLRQFSSVQAKSGLRCLFWAVLEGLRRLLHL